MLGRLTIAFLFLMALTGPLLADTVVMRSPACTDRNLAAQIHRLLGADRAPEAMKIFREAYSINVCRMLRLGEVVAVTRADPDLVRVLSFTARDRKWTSAQALGRCDRLPPWLPRPKPWLSAWLQPDRAASRARYAQHIGAWLPSGRCDGRAHRTAPAGGNHEDSDRDEDMASAKDTHVATRRKNGAGGDAQQAKRARMGSRRARR